MTVALVLIFGSLASYGLLILWAARDHRRRRVTVELDFAEACARVTVAFSDALTPALRTAAAAAESAARAIAAFGEAWRKAESGEAEKPS